MQGDLAVTGNPEADALLNTDPFALLTGMLLDQQFPMERAFYGPFLIRERTGSFDAATIAVGDPDELAAVFRGPPAVHQYWGAMSKRVQALAQHVIDEYKGDAAALWETAADAPELVKRLRALPGFGEQKAKIFTALLAKRFGVTPAGWEKAAGDYSDSTPRSVADIDSPDVLLRVREFKKAQKAKNKASAD